MSIKDEALQMAIHALHEKHNGIGLTDNQYKAIDKCRAALENKEQCNHCWHGTGQMLTSNPPQIPEVCCYCGERRTRTEQRYYTVTGHGKFVPSNWNVVNIG